MSYWLLNAMQATTKADRDDIQLYLMGLTRLKVSGKVRRKKKAKVVEEMAGTLALLIVRKTNYKGAKTASARDAARIARSYVNARKFSSGYLKSGFNPGLRSLRTSANEKTPRYKDLPGSFGEEITADNIRLTAENFAAAIAKKFPDAFEKGAKELAERLGAFLQDDMLTEQSIAGLEATR